MSAFDLYDITLIGGGPVGLFGCFYAGLRAMRTKVVDSLPELGGQLSALYPEKYVYDMPGFPRVLARDLAAALVEQALRFEPTVVLGEAVETVAAQPDGTFVLGTPRGEHHTRTVVVCAGPGALRPRTIEVPGVRELEGAGVYYVVREKGAFAGKRVLIVGGGDSALDWAMNLEPLAESITLIHRRDSFRAHEETVDWLLRRSRVTTRLFWELRRLEGAEHLERAVIYDNRTGEEETLEVDACLFNIGFAASLGPLRHWGLAMEGHQVVVSSRMETSVPGMYAAGDVCTYDGKLNLIATGAGEVAIAVNGAKTRIDPRARFYPGHSTNLNL